MTAIAIVGSGLIGRAWATVFASHGFDVAMHDVAPGAAKAARAHIGRNLKELAGHGLVDDPARSLAAHPRRLRPRRRAEGRRPRRRRTGRRRSRRSRRCSREMDALAPPACILASSTSFIMASRVQREPEGPRALPRRASGQSAPSRADRRARARALDRSGHRCAGAGASTSRPVRSPIILRKEKLSASSSTGCRPCCWPRPSASSAKACARAEDLDKTIRDGLGLRWSFMGPFETIELNAPGGIPDYARATPPRSTRW